MTSTNAHPLTPGTRVSRSPQQVHCGVGDVIVLMSVGDGKYFELNQVGTRIWQLLEQPASIADLVDQLLREFDVARSPCEADVIAWVGRMRDLGFVNIDDVNASAR